MKLILPFLFFMSANAFAVEFSKSNVLYDLKWNYSGEGKNTLLTYSFKNKTDISISPVGLTVRITCQGGSKSTKRFSLRNGKSTEVLPGKTITLQEKAIGGSPPLCRYSNGKVTDAKLDKEIQVFQRGIRKPNIKCGGKLIPVIVKMSIKQHNYFKIYTANEIITFNWKNIVAKAKTNKIKILRNARIAEIQKSICKVPYDHSNSAYYTHVYNYINEWASFCDEDKRECIKQYKKVIASIRG